MAGSTSPFSAPPAHAPHHPPAGPGGLAAPLASHSLHLAQSALMDTHDSAIHSAAHAQAHAQAGHHVPAHASTSHMSTASLSGGEEGGEPGSGGGDGTPPVHVQFLRWLRALLFQLLLDLGEVRSGSVRGLHRLLVVRRYGMRM